MARIRYVVILAVLICHSCCRKVPVDGGQDKRNSDMELYLSGTLFETISRDGANVSTLVITGPEGARGFHMMIRHRDILPKEFFRKEKDFRIKIPTPSSLKVQEIPVIKRDNLLYIIDASDIEQITEADERSITVIFEKGRSGKRH